MSRQKTLPKRKLHLNAHQQMALNALIYIVLLQFLLGVFTIIYSVPVVLAVLHQTGAFFLFASVLFFIHRLGKRKLDQKEIQP